MREAPTRANTSNDGLSGILPTTNAPISLSRSVPLSPLTPNDPSPSMAMFGVRPTPTRPVATPLPLAAVVRRAAVRADAPADAVPAVVRKARRGPIG